MPERVLIKFDDPQSTLHVNGSSRKATTKDGETLSKGTKRRRNAEPTGEGLRPPRQVNFRPTKSKEIPRQDRPNRQVQELLEIRQALPIAAHADEIRSKLRQSQVLILAGETGSGKSTQIPQFLVDEEWCRPEHVPKEGKVGGCIAVTQPRRLAAISLASRVAAEMGTAVGAQVGYSVRFDAAVSAKTRIKFLTEGMLLQEMLRDPYLREYSAVIVDEVHERSVNVDLVLGLVRKLMTEREGLKVVIMSATADMEAIERFFGDADTDSSLDSEPWSGLSPSPSKSIATCTVKGRQHPVRLVYSPSPVQNIVEAALKSVLHIHTHEPLPGDVLVFLTGQEAVETFCSACVEAYTALIQSSPAPIPGLQVFPLFAALPQSQQQSVFSRLPPRTRKVIVSTNIAETSLTVPGVRYVVDSGKCKQKAYRSRLGLSSLLVTPISKSSATQRAGRAGREAPGVCYRLYTERDYLLLEADTAPEIQRADLARLVLELKVRGVDDLLNFRLVTTPPRAALERALLQLLGLGALDRTGAISAVGKALAHLPLPPAMGRVLIAACGGLACEDAAIDLLAAMSVEGIFRQPAGDEERERVEEARQDVRRREGDHWTLIAAVQGFLAESNRKEWCRKRWINWRGMNSVLDVRKQLIGLVREGKGGWLTDALDPTPSQDLEAVRLLRCLLVGFKDQVACLMPDRSYKTLTAGRQTVSIHPSSVLFGKSCEAILYTEYVFTTKSYARGVSQIEMGWLRDET